MADELELLTINAASNGWVDSVPSAVSTGYTAQNTNIEAHRDGMDLSSISWDSGDGEIDLQISGVMDENGLPIVAKSIASLDLATPGAGTYFIKVISGSTTTKRSVSLVTTPGTWDHAKMGYYDSGDRILNWIIVYDGTNDPLFYKRGIFSTAAQYFLNDAVLGVGDSNGVGINFRNITTGLNASQGFEVGIDSDEHALLKNYENTDLRILTNNTETARMKANGELLINTTTALNDYNVKLRIDGKSSDEGKDITGNSNRLHGQYTADQIFDNLSPFLVDTDDRMLLNGIFYATSATGTIYVCSNVKRNSSTVVSIECISFNGSTASLTSIGFSDGGATTYRTSFTW